MGLVPGVLIAFISITVAMIVAGSFFLYKGWKRRGRYATLRETTLATPATVGDGDTVILTGSARHDGDQITAPIAGEGALLAGWDLLEWRDTGSSAVWVPEARGLRTAGFRVQDGPESVTIDAYCDESVTATRNKLTGFTTLTGPSVGDVAVEADAYDTELDVEPEETPPDRIKSLERAVGLDGIEEETGISLLPWTTPKGTRRYREVTVTDGDTVTLRATLRREADGSVSFSIPDDGMALVSTLDPETLQKRYRRAYWKLFYGMHALTLVMALLGALVVWL